MTRNDWILVWLWVAFIAVGGPFLVSARDSLLFFAGLAIFAGLTFVTQRRVRAVIKEKKT